MLDPTLSLGPDGGLVLTLEAEHRISIPATERGMRIILRILRERQRKPESRFADKGRPIQYMIEQWMREDREAREAEIAEAKLSLEDLGL